MCHPILVGVAIGAATGAVGAAVTGQDPLMGALMGGAMGGVTAGFFPGSVGSLGTGATGTAGIGQATVQLGGYTFTQAGLLTAGAVGLGGSIAKGMLFPEQRNIHQNLTGMPYTPQAYNTQHTKVTGSGGRQAAAVLASEIKQAKSLRKRQAEVADYGLGMDMAGTGLQIA